MEKVFNIRALGPSDLSIKPITSHTTLFIDGGGLVVRWCWVNFQCRGVLLILVIVGQGSAALAVGADWGYLDIFSVVYHFSLLFSLSGRRPALD